MKIWKIWKKTEKNMEKTKKYGKKTEKYRAKFSVFHEFTNFSLFIATMGSGTICQSPDGNSHKFMNISIFITTMGNGRICQMKIWKIWRKTEKIWKKLIIREKTEKYRANFSVLHEFTIFFDNYFDDGE